MKVVFPILNGKVLLTRDEKNYLRPAMGNDNVDAAKTAELAFGAHGFVDKIGMVHLSGATVEFWQMKVQQMIPSTKKSSLEIVETEVDDLSKAIRDPNRIVSIFLDLGVRMMEDYASSKP